MSIKPMDFEITGKIMDYIDDFMDKGIKLSSIKLSKGEIKKLGEEQCFRYVPGREPADDMTMANKGILPEGVTFCGIPLRAK